MSLSRSKALIIALVIVGVAFGLKTYNQTEAPQIFRSKTAPSLGVPGSEHSHMSIMVVLDGQPLNFYQSKYIEKDDRAHFHVEDIGGYFIHKHARGVTLPFFLSTLEIKLTADCLTLDTGEQYCSDDANKLAIYVNRKPYRGNLDFYELQDGDKILIDYGTYTPIELMLEANGIPDIPADLSQKE